MNFRLVDARWDKELDDAILADHSSLMIVCPFIKRRTAERLLGRGRPNPLRVITRFNLRDFSDGVSDITALEVLLNRGALIRGVRNLHAKMYLFGSTRAVVTSANLTEAALSRNHEFGFVADDPSILNRCREYFNGLWGRSGSDIQAQQLSEWKARINLHHAAGGRPADRAGLGDEGVDVGISAPTTVFAPAWVAQADQAFVKFFGQAGNRADRTTLVLEEIESSGCHWACTYPRDKRPRIVRDGAVMFMARLVTEPDDIMIYGRAVGIRYQHGRDDASPQDIERRPWKATWPHYVRVHHAEFLNGTLGNGVSLNDLMSELGADAFAPTQRNARKGGGNTDPRRAYMRQAAVELSPEGFSWLRQKLEESYLRHGKLSPKTLDTLDWPELAMQAGAVA